ncbi:MFS general substrate transporter [Pyrenophora teres f. teres]|uniref:MFS general substrate transporter n=1 Tax=Pyrenophora teres f. teres TaxID=97479 RepID=A0A6S6WAE0_9PLEO|nr:MFS general substrate transporter [Pyrenophora teres f. teres]
MYYNTLAKFPSLLQYHGTQLWLYTTTIPHHVLPQQTPHTHPSTPSSPNPDMEKSPSGQPTRTPSITALGPAPDGGLTAWLNCAAAFCIFFCCLGFTSCFGVLQEYYSTHQLHDHSMNAIAWIGSLAGFIQFVGGVVGGPVFDRWGVWVCIFFSIYLLKSIIRPATLLYILGLMLLSLCTHYPHFILAQSLLMGSAVAFLQFLAFALMGHYFDKRRAAALGIIVSGSSVGGLVFPIVLSKLLNCSSGASLGFGWSIRIVAFVMAPFMLFACVVLRPRFPCGNTIALTGLLAVILVRTSSFPR